MTFKDESRSGSCGRYLIRSPSRVHISPSNSFSAKHTNRLYANRYSERVAQGRGLEVGQQAIVGTFKTSLSCVNCCKNQTRMVVTPNTHGLPTYHPACSSTYTNARSVDAAGGGGVLLLLFSPTPAMILSTVLFPLPFTPSTPTLAPLTKLRLASAKSCLPPGSCFDTPSRVMTVSVVSVLEAAGGALEAAAAAGGEAPAARLFLPPPLALLLELSSLMQLPPLLLLLLLLQRLVLVSLGVGRRACGRPERWRPG